MKKTVIAALLATSFGVPGAFAQTFEEAQQTEAYRQLVDQYATATLGFLIEDRCRQLDPVGYNDFLKNQKILNVFIADLIGQEPWQKLLLDMDHLAQDAETNPCNSDTFKFAVATSQISSKMATRVQLLGTAGLSQPSPQSQPETASTPGPENPVPTQAQPEASQPAPEPVDNTPLSNIPIEPVATTQVERQPESEKQQKRRERAEKAKALAEDSSPSETAVKPVVSPTPQPAGTKISLSNYVNPFPYSAPAAPGGETEKVAKRRHRHEIIDLRRAQRAEMSAFKDNQDNYIDAKAVKKTIEKRHSAEYTAIRNRHQQELQAFK
ncbi:MAG: hypothetical protein V3R64_01920 [Sphingomonadales bacterium]